MVILLLGLIAFFAFLAWCGKETHRNRDVLTSPTMQAFAASMKNVDRLAAEAEAGAGVSAGMWAEETTVTYSRPRKRGLARRRWQR